jgi:hypothetical protein
MCVGCRWYIAGCRGREGQDIACALAWNWSVTSEPDDLPLRLAACPHLYSRELPLMSLLVDDLSTDQVLAIQAAAAIQLPGLLTERWHEGRIDPYNGVRLLRRPGVDGAALAAVALEDYPASITSSADERRLAAALEFFKGQDDAAVLVAVDVLLEARNPNYLRGAALDSLIDGNRFDAVATATRRSARTRRFMSHQRPAVLRAMRRAVAPGTTP